MEKQRTRITRRTLDPLIQQTLLFKENYQGKILQVKLSKTFPSEEFRSLSLSLGEHLG